MDIRTRGGGPGKPGRPAGTERLRRRGLAAPLALPAAFAGLLLVGALAAGTAGRVGATSVLILAAVIVGAGSAVAEARIAPLLGMIGWLTVAGFSGRPYAQLQPTGPAGLRAGIVMAGCSLGGAAAGALARRLASSVTLWIVTVPEEQWPPAVRPDLRGQAEPAPRGAAHVHAPAPDARQPPRWRRGLRKLADVASLPGGIGGRRLLLAAVIGAAGLPLLTAALVAGQHWLTLADDLLIYLVAVVAVAVAGGFWPAVLAAVAASLLLNWYFTRPVHTLTIADPQNLLALLLFVTVAVAVSSVVHLAAHRAVQAAQAGVLAEGNRMRTALLAAVSHDLRTPLASIKASVSTLRQDDVQWTPADQAALLAAIEEGADRLDALIGNLLDMSRLSAGSLQPLLRPTAVEEVAPAALRGLDGSAAAGGSGGSSSRASTVTLGVPDGLPLVRTDPGLLERVLANLFANALAYSPPGRPPAMSARQAGDSVILQVSDHGPGVPDAFKARMFEPFTRMPQRAARPGVGLGLAVVKGFVEVLGGSVAAADTPGGGLTVTVTLPAAGTAPAAPAATVA